MSGCRISTNSTPGTARMRSRGLLRLGVEDRHDTSDQERNAVLALADRRRNAAAWWLEARAQAGQLPPRAHDRSQSDGLGCFCRRAERAQTARLGDQLPQGGAREPAFWLRPSQSLHLGSSGFDDPSIGHARRADGFARAASKAEVDVTGLVFREWKAAALPLGHQVDAAA